MDDYEIISPAREFNMPAPEAEFSMPRPEGEYTPPVPEGRALRPGPEEERSGGRSKKRLKKLIRAVAAVTVAATMALSVEEAPPEIVDVESRVEIECAAVAPEAPNVLRFRYMDYRSLYEEEPVYTDEEIHVYLSGPDGEERELKPVRDPQLYRPVYVDAESETRLAAYRSDETPDSAFSLNLGCDAWSALVRELEPGSALKVVYTWRDGNTIKRMSAVREIVTLPPAAECTASVQLLSSALATDEVEFVAVLHPQQEDDFVFGNQSFSRMGFCTRWYDAQGAFLGEGWCFAAPESVRDWPFPDAWRSGGDIVFLYRGPVRADAANAEAAYYSLEMRINEENTGWPFVFESERLPVHAD